MPPPTVICKICKQTVLKAQTYHVGGGERACKAHEGIEQQKELLLIQQKQQREEQERRKLREEEQRRKDAEEARQALTDRRPRCWVCGHTGILHQVFYYNLLIYGKKQELKGITLNPFAPEYTNHIRASQGLKPGEKLTVVTILSIPRDHPVIKILGRNQAQVASVAGAISICADCAEKHKVERPIPKMELKDMFLLGSMMEPVVRELAEKSLAKEAQGN